MEQFYDAPFESESEVDGAPARRAQAAMMAAGPPPGGALAARPSKRSSSLPQGAGAGAGAAGSVFSQLQAQLQANDGRIPDRINGIGASGNLMEQPTSPNIYGLPLPFPGSDSGQLRANGIQHQHHPQVSAASSTSTSTTQRQPASSPSSSRPPQLPAIPSSEVIAPVPQRRIVLPDSHHHDPGHSASFTDADNSQQQQENRPNSFFGALNNGAAGAPPSSSRMQSDLHEKQSRQAGLGYGQAQQPHQHQQRSASASIYSSQGPSPASSNVSQPRHVSSSSTARPNSFFGALDNQAAGAGPASTAEEPSRSYIQQNRISQQRSLPTPPPQTTAQSLGLVAGTAYPRSTMAHAALPTLRTQSQPSQPRYSHVSQYQQHAQHASTSSSSASTYHQHAQQQRQLSSAHSYEQQQQGGRSSFYGMEGHARSDSDAPGPALQQPQQQRSQSQSPLEVHTSASAGTNGESGFRSSSRSDRAGSPSSRHMSSSLPRSETGNYTTSSFSGQSSDMFAANNMQRRSRLPSASWTNSNPSSIYGLNAISPQVGGEHAGQGQNQHAPPVVLSQAHLRPGDKVALLSHHKTLELYRANVKKTNDPEITYELATFMLNLAREMGLQEQQQQATSASNQASEENLIASFSQGGGMLLDHSASPSPDPSMSFHSRSSGSSGDLAAGLSAIVGAAAGRKRSSHSPASGSAQSHAGTGGSGQQPGRNGTSSPTATGGSSSGAMDRRALINEAMALLKRNADRGHNPSQYFLADCYAQGNAKRNSGPPINTNVIIGAIAEKGNSGAGKADFDKALPLYISAAKHGHSPSCFKAGQCCEFGWGCRKDAGKAVQFYTWVPRARMMRFKYMSLHRAEIGSRTVACRFVGKPQRNRTRRRCIGWAWPS